MQKLAIEYLQTTKDRLPDKTAVVDSGRSITFAELWRRGVELGHALKVATEARNVPFLIDIDKSIEAIVAMTAVQLSGNIYVPFDVETPPERRRRLTGSLGAHHVLGLDGVAFQLDGRPVEAPGRSSPAAMEDALLASLKARTSLDPLYIIFTSGSTGVPKGVTIANASVIDYIDWVVRTYGITESEVLGSQAPFYFDNSVLDLYATLARGCTLHLPPRDGFLFLPQLVDYLAENAVTFLFFVPSVLSNIAALDLLDRGRLPALRKVLFCGEVMPRGTLEYLRDRLPGALLSNLYGPTEITDACIFWIMGGQIEQDAPVPLGRPCENTDIVFLDDEGRVVQKDDEAGEICVGGIGVALGYWNDPERTRAAFIQNPAESRYRQVLYRTGDLGYRSSKDGLIYIVGRKDDQIKHMGHRIELGEIQSALNRVPGIVHSSAQYDPEKKSIVAFYCSADAGKEVRGLREALTNELPPYMLPRELIPVEKIPITASGKVDRAALWEIRKRRARAPRR